MNNAAQQATRAVRFTFTRGPSLSAQFARSMRLSECVDSIESSTGRHVVIANASAR